MAAEGAERAQVRERTPRASNMRDLRTLSCLAVPVHGHWAGGEKATLLCAPLVLKTLNSFQTSRLFYFPVFVGFQAPGLTECPRKRLKDEAGTEECEARVATAD